MYELPRSIKEAIEELQKLPGIGAKTAERLVFFLLGKPDAFAEKFGSAIFNVKKNWGFCETCFSYSEREICSICEDSERWSNLICVVEEVTDLIAIEKTRGFQGKYHVLGGAIAPLKGIGPESVRIQELRERIEKNPEIKELILATNPNMEGETTAMYIAKELKDFPELKITRLARGLPAGGDLEYVDDETISRAIMNRTGF